MTDEIRQAFAHPEERASAIGGLADRLSLRDYVVSADIGAFQRRRVVHPIAGHGNDVTEALQGPHDTELV